MDALVFDMEQVSSLFIYFYPGLITILVYNFFSGLKFENGQHVWIKSIGYSYVYGLIVTEDVKCAFNWIVPRELVLIVIAIFLGVLFAKLRYQKRVLEVLRYIKKDKCFKHNPFDIIKDEDGSIWGHVYLKDKDIVYCGTIVVDYLDDKTRNYIVLSGYQKYVLGCDGKRKGEFVLDFVNDETEQVIIYYDEIRTIEVLRDSEDEMGKIVSGKDFVKLCNTNDKEKIAKKISEIKKENDYFILLANLEAKMVSQNIWSILNVALGIIISSGLAVYTYENEIDMRYYIIAVVIALIVLFIGLFIAHRQANIKRALVLLQNS